MPVIDFGTKRKQALERLQTQISDMRAVLGAMPSDSIHREKIVTILKALRLKAARLSIPVRVRAASAEKRRKMN
jgi:hypothetical protein